MFHHSEIRMLVVVAQPPRHTRHVQTKSSYVISEATRISSVCQTKFKSKALACLPIQFNSFLPSATLSKYHSSRSKTAGACTRAPVMAEADLQSSDAMSSPHPPSSTANTANSTAPGTQNSRHVASKRIDDTDTLKGCQKASMCSSQTLSPFPAANRSRRVA